GRSVGAAFLRLFTLQKACEAQIMTQAGGGGLLTLSQEVQDRVHTQVLFTEEILNTLNWQAIIRKADRDFPNYKT
ncbi:MAG: class II aldolase, partial [Sphingomonadales bacterium]